MNTLLQFILPFLLLYKYWAIFTITFVAAFIFPIPPGTLLMTASAFAQQGFFSFSLVVIVGTLGNILGDNAGYWLARMYGEKVLIRIGFRRILESRKFKGVERRIKESPGIFIFFTRFEVFSNLASNLIAGLSKVPYGKYLFFEVIGEAAQVFIYCSIGYFLSSSWPAISQLINRFLLLIILAGALLVVIFWKKISRWIDKS